MRATEYLGGPLREKRVEANSVPQRVFEASVWQYWQEGRYDTESL